MNSTRRLTFQGWAIYLHIVTKVIPIQGPPPKEEKLGEWICECMLIVNMEWGEAKEWNWVNNLTQLILKSKIKQTTVAHIRPQFGSIHQLDITNTAVLPTNILCKHRANWHGLTIFTNLSFFDQPKSWFESKTFSICSKFHAQWWLTTCPFNGPIATLVWLPTAQGSVTVFAFGCTDSSIHVYVQKPYQVSLFFVLTAHLTFM